MVGHWCFGATFSARIQDSTRCTGCRTCDAGNGMRGCGLGSSGPWRHRCRRVHCTCTFLRSRCPWSSRSSDASPWDLVEPQTSNVPKILGAKQTNPDVSGTSPFLQHRWVEVVGGTGSLIEQHHGNLAVLQRHNLWVFSGADDVVVAGNWLVGVLAKVRLTIGGGIGKVLPRRPGLAIIRGLLQRPETRTRGVAHANEQIGHMEFLKKRTV